MRVKPVVTREKVPGTVISLYVIGTWLVEMPISTNHIPDTRVSQFDQTSPDPFISHPPKATTKHSLKWLKRQMSQLSPKTLIAYWDLAKKTITVMCQQTQHIEPMLVQSWPIIYDAGRTLNQHSQNACFPGMDYSSTHIVASPATGIHIFNRNNLIKHIQLIETRNL